MIDRLLKRDEAVELVCRYIQENYEEEKTVSVVCSDLKIFVEFPIVVLGQKILEGGLYAARE